MASFVKLLATRDALAALHHVHASPASTEQRRAEHQARAEQREHRAQHVKSTASTRPGGGAHPFHAPCCRANRRAPELARRCSSTPSCSKRRASSSTGRAADVAGKHRAPRSNRPLAPPRRKRVPTDEAEASRVPALRAAASPPLTPRLARGAAFVRRGGGAAPAQGKSSPGPLASRRRLPRSLRSLDPSRPRRRDPRAAR